MKKNMWMKIITIGLLCLSLVACSSESTNEPNTPKAEQPSQEPPKQEQPTDQLVKKSGQFIGLVDNQSFEAEVEGERITIRFAEDVKETIQQIQPKSLVELEYYVHDNNQLELKSIKAEQQKEEPQKQEANFEKATWKFTGLVDTHSAEFMVDNEPLVAEYPEDLRNALESLEENQELVVYYKKDENGRFVLVKIEKVQ